MEAHQPHYYNYYLFCDFTRIYKFFNRFLQISVSALAFVKKNKLMTVIPRDIHSDLRSLRSLKMFESIPNITAGICPHFVAVWIPYRLEVYRCVHADIFFTNRKSISARPGFEYTTFAKHLPLSRHAWLFNKKLSFELAFWGSLWMNRGVPEVPWEPDLPRLFQHK